MKIKRTFVQGKLNKDLDERLLPEGQYPHAENIRVSNTEASDVGAVENVRGNYQLTGYSLINATTIGGIADGSNQKLYWLVTSDERDMIVEYDFRNSISTIVLESTAKTGVLNFNKDYLVTGIVKIINDDSSKDLLAWTDDINPPRIINIERAKKYGFNNFTEDDISVIKLPPEASPKIQLTYTNTSLENNLENKFLSFAYRYKYLDGELSALSSFSNYSFAPEKFNLDYQTMENIGMVNAFNAVNVTVNTGSKRVTDVEIVFKESNSNTVFLIETFNKKKEMWGDNELKTFKFSNSKKYAALPEDELYRPYDNVPLLAKALTLGGNRLIYGNYLEGYDLVNTHGEEVNIDYDVSLNTRNLGGTALTTSLMGNTSWIVNLSGVELKESSKITFSINLAEPVKTKGEFANSFDFILNRSYSSVTELVNDDDFKVFVEDIMTSIFSSSYTATIPANYSILEVLKFTFSGSGNSIIINTPKIKYSINNDVTNTVTYVWNFLPTSEASYSNVSVQTSLKSNRSYEVGIIYLDRHNRATTVLTDKNNTIYVPQSNAINQNRIVVNVNNEPPYWADRYKFVVKQNKSDYYNIYTNVVYRDGLYAWFKLEGSNKDKVKEGDYVILKCDLNRVYNNILKYQVLEIKDQPKDFIKDNVDSTGVEVEEQAGLYFRIKMEGFNISSENNKVYKATASARSNNKSVPPFCYIDLFTTVEGSAVKDLEIPSGSRIILKFDSSFNYKSGWSSHKMEKSFLVLKKYNNFKEWYDDIIPKTVLKCEQGHDYKDGLAVVRMGNKLALRVQGHETGGSGGRGGFVDAEVSIITSEDLFIFETESKDLNSDIYYETEQTFKISDNKHQGNIKNQSEFDPAIVELNFFNCYTQGNGVESYQYKDLFNSNYLNIDLRPVSTSVEKYKKVRRFADLTYGEPYNENNNVNGLNEFNLYKANYKEDINKNWGSIQKLRNRNNDILVFQEDKVSYVMYGKDLLMNADGTSNVSLIDDVLGNQVPYSGEYGISRVPESHAFDGFYDYWQDPKRGCVCRLSGDGINEISQYGMKQYFKDNFKNTINNKKLGGYDPYYDEYVVFTSNIEKIPPVNMTCSSKMVKESFTGEFLVNIDYGLITGECGFNYSTNGKPVRFVVEQNGISTDYGFSGDSTYNDELNAIGLPSVTLPNKGTLLFNKTDRNSVVTIRIFAPLSESSLNLSGICPVAEEGKVFMIITNEEFYEGKHYLTRYKYNDSVYSSPFKVKDNLFGKGIISSFEEISGNKGTGFIPSDNSSILMEVFYTSQEEPLFKNGGSFKYLKSNVILNPSDIQNILSSSTTLGKTESISINGDVTYRANFNVGVYKYLYLIYDHQSPPVAVDDNIQVNRGRAVTADIKANDSNPKGTAKVILQTLPNYGTVVVNADNTITYTHNSIYQINDSFTYLLNNGYANSNVANVYINVLYNPPVAVDDNLSVDKGKSVTYDLRTNDVDPEGLPLTVNINTLPNNGTVVVNSNGTITYTHNDSQNLTDVFTYYVNNTLAESNIADVNITVTEKPLVANDDSYSCPKLESITKDLRENDDNPYNKPLTVILKSQPIAGTVVANSDNTITYTNTDISVKTDSFTYAVYDGNRESNITTVTIGIDAFVFDADYAVFTYQFTDGKDLDTRTRIVLPDVQMTDYVGWNRLSDYPNNPNDNNILVKWAGDNTGNGFESVLVNIKNIKKTNENIEELFVDLRGFWFNTVGTNPVVIGAKFYKGGTMQLNQSEFTFSNPTAESSLDFPSNSKVITLQTQDKNTNGERIAVFKFNIQSKIGYFDMNDTTTAKSNINDNSSVENLGELDKTELK